MKKYTESKVEELRGLDRDVIYADVHSGLILIVRKQQLDKLGNDISKKVWAFRYRPKGKSAIRVKLGDANGPNSISRTAAINRLARLKTAIDTGQDPHFEKAKLKGEITLGDLVKKFYKDRLTKNYGYKPKTISGIKNTFKVWLFEDTQDPNCKNAINYSIKDIRISKFTNQKAKAVHASIRSKSGYVANRFIAYLKIVFNFAIETKIFTKENPCKIPKKHLFKEAETTTVLSDEQYIKLFRRAFVKDARTNRLNTNYYIKNNYNLIPCLAIAFLLSAGRRAESEGFSCQWSQVNEDTKKIFYADSKVGSKEYQLAPMTLDILQTMRRSLMNRDYKVIYERSEYIFPSGNKNSKCPHIQDIRTTWAKLLKDCNIPYMPLKQVRHSFATRLLRRSKNLKVVQTQLGHNRIETTMKYAKIVNEDVENALNDFSNSVEVNTAEENVVQLKLKSE